PEPPPAAPPTAETPAPTAADRPVAPRRWAAPTALGLALRALVLLPLCLLLAPEYPARDNAAAPAPTVKELVDDGGKLPGGDEMERLARTDPVAFLEKCLLRYEREVKGYRCKLKRQERVNGKLLPSENFDVAFREKPFSVKLEWPEEPRPARAI